jgi:hypothetical protein
MPLVGFEPMIEVFEREKTAYALNRAATVIGLEERFWIIHFDILLYIGIIFIQ